MFFVELSIFFLIDLKIRITMSSEEEEASDSNSGQSKSRLKSKKPPSLMIAIPKPEFDKKVKGLCGEKKKKNLFSMSLTECHSAYGKFFLCRLLKNRLDQHCFIQYC